MKDSETCDLIVELSKKSLMILMDPRFPRKNEEINKILMLSNKILTLLWNLNYLRKYVFETEHMEYDIKWKQEHKICVNILKDMLVKKYDDKINIFSYIVYHKTYMLTLNVDSKRMLEYVWYGICKYEADKLNK